MSTIKKISKISYDYVRDDAVRLIEYMIFLNETTLEKFIMLRIQNLSSSTLDRASVEVIQLNQLKEPIRKSDYLFERMGLLPRTSTVPLEKIAIAEDCVAIECKIIPIENPNTSLKDQNSIVKLDARHVESSTTYQQIEVKYQKLKYPYWIPILFVLVYVFVLLSVYFIIN